MKNEIEKQIEIYGNGLEIEHCKLNVECSHMEPSNSISNDKF